MFRAGPNPALRDFGFGVYLLNPNKSRADDAKFATLFHLSTLNTKTE
jgi:hypothetical protein